MIRHILQAPLVVAVVFSLYVLMILNWMVGSLRFTSPRLNVLSLTVSMAIPAICATLLFAVARRNPWRIGASVGLALLAIPSLYWGWLFWSFGHREVVTDEDTGFHLIQSLPSAGAPTLVYCDPGWMPDDPAIYVVRREYTILPGVIWTNELRRETCRAGVESRFRVGALDEHHLRCTLTELPSGCAATNRPVDHVETITVP